MQLFIPTFVLIFTHRAMYFNAIPMSAFAHAGLLRFIGKQHVCNIEEDAQPSHSTDIRTEKGHILYIQISKIQQNRTPHHTQSLGLGIEHKFHFRNGSKFPSTMDLMRRAFRFLISVPNFITKVITIPLWNFSVDIFFLEEVSSALSFVLTRLKLSHGYKLIG